MDKVNLGKDIKGVVVIDVEGKILNNVKIAKDTCPDYNYPILTASSFYQLGMTEKEPFDILKVVIDKGQVIEAAVIIGLKPIPKPTEKMSIEFTNVTNDLPPSNILNMWMEYLKPGAGNEA